MSAVARMLCAAAVFACLAAPSSSSAQPTRQAVVLRWALQAQEPALDPTFLPGVAWEWQWQAAHMDAVPDSVLRAARRITSAVIDSGADPRAPDVADKKPLGWSVPSRSHPVRDVLCHG